MKTINHYTQECLNALIGSNLQVDGIIGSKTMTEEKEFILRLQLRFQQNDKRWNHCNMIGIRMSDEYTNQFTDWLIITKGMSMVAVPFSTKPGWSAVKNKQYVESKKGCAVLSEGYHYDFWEIGKTSWTGMKYLQQRNPAKIYRDADLDGFIDRSAQFTGNYGINFHSWKNFLSVLVQNLSAGCQVCKADVHKLIWPYIELVFEDQGDSIDYALFHKETL